MDQYLGGRVDNLIMQTVDRVVSLQSSKLKTLAIYSRVCGRIIGYQVNTPDAFHPICSGPRDISNHYVDGISLTHGSNPRKHNIWTFAAGNNEYGDKYGCPCGNQSTDPENKGGGSHSFPIFCPFQVLKTSPIYNSQGKYLLFLSA
jgi:hypothetical protein